MKKLLIFQFKITSETGHSMHAETPADSTEEAIEKIVGIMGKPPMIIQLLSITEIVVPK